MYQVLDSYQRFDQKNNFVCRFLWDPSFRHLLPVNWETQLQHMKCKHPGFGLEDFALAASAQLIVSSFGTELNTPNAGLKSWDPLPLSAFFKFPLEKPALTDSASVTDKIKHVARYFGADVVGIANLDMRWVYSRHYLPEAGESKPVMIDDEYKSVIVMAVEMDYEMVQTAPSALYLAETLLTYSRMALLVSSLAQFIRQLGYQAIPSLNDTGLNIPIAVDGGLGELGRNGLLITPQFGPRLRLCKVITNVPLQPDKPSECGVNKICSVCRICAQKCPSQAISFGEMTAESPSLSNNPGVLKWFVSGEKCWEYRLRNFGTNCGICVRVCPFNKKKGILRDSTRLLLKHAPWMNRIVLWMDNRLGYGDYRAPDFFWSSGETRSK